MAKEQPQARYHFYGHPPCRWTLVSHYRFHRDNNPGNLYHLGHQRTPSESTLEALDRVINPKTLKDLDVLLIAGDFFDHLLQFPDDRVLEIDSYDDL